MGGGAAAVHQARMQPAGPGGAGWQAQLRAPVQPAGPGARAAKAPCAAGRPCLPPAAHTRTRRCLAAAAPASHRSGPQPHLLHLPHPAPHPAPAPASPQGLREPAHSGAGRGPGGAAAAAQAGGRHGEGRPEPGSLRAAASGAGAGQGVCLPLGLRLPCLEVGSALLVGGGRCCWPRVRVCGCAGAAALGWAAGALRAEWCAPARRRAAGRRPAGGWAFARASCPELRRCAASCAASHAAPAPAPAPGARPRREQSSAENPPCLLPCNHVLCEQSILKIARARNKVFKCPYCPMEARADNVRPLTFPDVE